MACLFHVVGMWLNTTSCDVVTHCQWAVCWWRAGKVGMGNEETVGDISMEMSTHPDARVFS